MNKVVTMTLPTVCLRCSIKSCEKYPLGELYFEEYNRDRHPFSFKIGELFKMDYSAVSQAAKRFEQKTEVDNEIKEYRQKVITALKEI